MWQLALVAVTVQCTPVGQQPLCFSHWLQSALFHMSVDTIFATSAPLAAGSLYKALYKCAESSSDSFGSPAVRHVSRRAGTLRKFSASSRRVGNVVDGGGTEGGRLANKPTIIPPTLRGRDGRARPGCGVRGAGGEGTGVLLIREAGGRDMENSVDTCTDT